MTKLHCLKPLSCDSTFLYDFKHPKLALETSHSQASVDPYQISSKKKKNLTMLWNKQIGHTTGRCRPFRLSTRTRWINSTWYSVCLELVSPHHTNLNTFVRSLTKWISSKNFITNVGKFIFTIPSKASTLCKNRSSRELVTARSGWVFDSFTRSARILRATQF